MTPKEIEKLLKNIYERALASIDKPVIANGDILARVDYVCRCLSNRAGVRLLMSCLLGKLVDPRVDPRKPYTEIGSPDSFSGRTYDEQYITSFVNKYHLPCNPTTAFLTPTLRNIDQPLTLSRDLVGRPRDLYKKTLQLLDDLAKKRIDADSLFIETVRVLLNLRNEQDARMASLLAELKHTEGALPLSSEAIVTLVAQHLACKHSSRLPVLVVAAAYQAVEEKLGEKVKSLNSHNAADLQTGSMGDVEICLVGDDAVVTTYEMKMKRVTRDDIDSALTKIARSSARINNYIFVTTDQVDPEVKEYAARLYEETGGTELVILDCIGFLRHFLHLFHRARTKYLNSYQDLVLAESNSAVSQQLKEAFLALRRSAESGG